MWWAHLEFARINIELTFQKNQIEEYPEILRSKDLRLLFSDRLVRPLAAIVS